MEPDEMTHGCEDLLPVGYAKLGVNQGTILLNPHVRGQITQNPVYVFVDDSCRSRRL